MLPLISAETSSILAVLVSRLKSVLTNFLSPLAFATRAISVSNSNSEALFSSAALGLDAKIRNALSCFHSRVSFMPCFFIYCFKEQMLRSAISLSCSNPSEYACRCSVVKDGIIRLYSGSHFSFCFLGMISLYFSLFRAYSKTYSLTLGNRAPLIAAVILTPEVLLILTQIVLIRLSRSTSSAPPTSDKSRSSAPFSLSLTSSSMTSVSAWGTPSARRACRSTASCVSTSSSF